MSTFVIGRKAKNDIGVVPVHAVVELIERRGVFALGAVVVEEDLRDRVGVRRKRRGQDAVRGGDVAVLVERDLVGEPRVGAPLGVDPALPAEVVHDLLALLTRVVVLVAAGHTARHVVHRGRGDRLDTTVSSRRGEAAAGELVGVEPRKLFLDRAERAADRQAGQLAPGVPRHVQVRGDLDAVTVVEPHRRPPDVPVQREGVAPLGRGPALSCGARGAAALRTERGRSREGGGGGRTRGGDQAERFATFHGMDLIFDQQRGMARRSVLP
ncbi:hypothetical protein [Streptomyces sp. NPDC052015]|uniref:hypothetical protein n=1 Tax=Streptomyces sp. NPDC052015 TaxID=3154755 RepID=UPI0034383D2A